MDGTAVETRLLKVVEDDDRPSDVRAQAIFTLGKVGGDRSRETLQGIVDDTEDEQIRKRAFSALSKLGGSADDLL
jgi:HEAT repeat protein